MFNELHLHRAHVRIRLGVAMLACSMLLGAVCTMLPTPLQAQDAEVPPGWSEATHGDDAAPDYARLFTLDRVHELHIAIEPEDFAAMQEDLQSIGPGFVFARGGFGGPGDGRGFGPPDGASEAGPTGAGGFRGGGLPGRGGQAPEMTSRDPIYVPVTVTHDGRTWPGVGMRYKGNSSLMTAIMSGAGKVPFRLDFDRYEDEIPGTRNQRFYGFDKLTFSSNFSDDSMLKEVLATEVFRDRGVPAARAAFYRVFVDVGTGPEYWGLYTMVEDPADGAMLDAQFGDGGGNLYKPSGPGADWTFFDSEGFAKKTHEKAEDFSDVAAAITALHASQADPAAWRRGLEATLDVDLFLRWLAVNTVIENWDSYGRMAHNYYLYADPADEGRLKWLPWDHNMSFGMGGGGFGGMGGRGLGAFRFELGPGSEGVPNARGPIVVRLEGGQFPEGSADGQFPFPLPEGVEPGQLPFPVPAGAADAGGNGARMAFMMMGGGDDILHTNAGNSWPLIQRVLADEVYAARYRELLLYSLEGLFAPEAFEARARELHALIAPYVVGEQGETPTHTTLSGPGAFANALDGPGGLFERVAARRRQVESALAAD